MWVLMIEIGVGLLVAFYLRAGVIAAFTEWASTKIRTRGVRVRLADGRFCVLQRLFQPAVQRSHLQTVDG